MKEKFYNFIQLSIDTIKFRGLLKGLRIILHLINIQFRQKRYSKKKKYKLLGLKFYYDNYFSLQHLILEHFAGNYYFFKSEREGSIIFDVGANIGDSILYFKSLYPKSKIYAFEPHPRAFELLKQNVEANHFSNVLIYNEALSNHNGSIQLYSDEDSTFLRSSTKQRDQQRSEQVSARRFFDKVIGLGVERIDLLKIDIEGGESDLMGDVARIINKIDNIIIEYHLLDDNSNSFDKILDILHNAGFLISIFNTHRSSLNMPNIHTCYIVGKRFNF